MRPLPSPLEFGTWETLPEDPPEHLLDLSDEDVKDTIRCRDILKQEWSGYLHYPHGFWPDASIKPDIAGQGEAWRNWLLRPAWDSVATLNAHLRRQAGI
ncbi:hypothetical protein [Saccharopolyspora spinosa]|uniref:Uncharacterized protein n=1 Tax=Saccharopolyspora spinosa TaxID=60894 RepID=A0A2N3XX94_SACSN|nr:hypothetical protein [Saccharopolyspora spinosa]PKW15295.1 hypothetical protein A8926_2988 [Saccharopolyspora spinosa]